MTAPTTPHHGRGSFRIKPCRALSACYGSGFTSVNVMLRTNPVASIGLSDD
jgi:hypothetical protein